MARPSKLSPAQWHEVEKRAAEGESLSALAREFGVGRSTISDRVSVVSGRVRETAQRLADAQAALAELPARQQHMAVSLAEKMRNISRSLASAAELGADTAHRLHEIANTEIARLDDSDPVASIEAIKAVGVMTRVANDSASIALGLLAANKDAARDDDAAPAGLDVALLSDAALREIAAARDRGGV